MENGKYAVDFFLGANTPQGFVSRFDQLADPAEGWRKFIIKGGPGTGKSGLMKRLAAELSQHTNRIERIHCSSDVGSLDAVIAADLKASIADGTAPHVIEPQYPGAYETTVNLAECWDEEALQQERPRVMAYSTENAHCHERCCRFLAAAGSLLNDSYRIAAEYADAGKIARYAARLAGKEFGGKTKGVRGKETVRFLSAVTAQGVTSFPETPRALCERIYLVEDEYGAVSRLLLSALRSHALEAGLNIVSCYCISSPFEKLEHLLIPELGVGFLTCNRYHPFNIECYRTIHAKRFLDAEGMRGKKQRLSFNRKAVAELLAEASNLLAEAKAVHDKLETCYTVHMNFAGVDAKTKQVTQLFLNRRTPE